MNKTGLLSLAIALFAVSILFCAIVIDTSAEGSDISWLYSDNSGVSEYASDIQPLEETEGIWTAKWEQVSEYNRFVLGNKVGIIDAGGNLIIEPRFDLAFLAFGNILVYDKNLEQAYVYENGQLSKCELWDYMVEGDLFEEGEYGFWVWENSQLEFVNCYESGSKGFGVTNEYEKTGNGWTWTGGDTGGTFGERDVPVDETGGGDSGPGEISEEGGAGQ